MAEELLLQLEVRCDEQAPGVARSALTGLSGIGRAVADLVLIASELVTNAILHSGGTRSDVLTLRLVRRDDHLELSVRDPGRSGDEAGLAEERAPGDGGLGLRIVEMVATRWGQTRADGYRVWAEIPLAASLRAPSRSPGCDQGRPLTATSTTQRR